MDQNPPQKPTQGIEMGVPVDKNNPYANVPVGVAAPAPQPAFAHASGQPAQVDAYGRPVVMAVPMQVTTQVVANNSNIRRDAQGNALCNKCSAPYPLPPGTTSWR